MAGLIAYFGSAYSSAKVYSQVSSEKTGRTEDTEQREAEIVRKKSSRVKRFKNYFSKVLFDTLAEYGPPYEFDEYYNGALLFQCSRPIEKSLEVHRLLNAKIDPNDVDPTELNYTPMHWCAKHCYLKSMRMLVMAKAHINVTNEFGQSPLSLCMMMMQPLNKRGVQIEMVEYLLDIGANIEIRDKSGNRPLDYAILNQNVALINMCLDYGALVRRDNKHFSVQTAALLDQVDDEDCLERIENALFREMAGEREKEMEDNLRQEQEDRDNAIREARVTRQEKRLKKIADRTKNSERLVLEEVARLKKKKIDDDFMLAKAAKAIAEHGAGSWSRDDTHHWNWNARTLPKKLDNNRIYNDGLKIVDDVRERRSIESLNKRWENITGAKLEVAWESMKGFENVVELNKRNNNLEEIKEEEEVAVVLPFDFKDVNDNLLEGEDLDLLNI